MRTVHILVLRLFVDPAQPRCLRGALRSVPDGEEVTFAGEQALLQLLRSLVDEEPTEPTRLDVDRDRP
jgi:hypothetical protein